MNKFLEGEKIYLSTLAKSESHRIPGYGKNPNFTEREEAINDQ